MATGSNVAAEIYSGGHPWSPLPQAIMDPLLAGGVMAGHFLSHFCPLKHTCGLSPAALCIKALDRAAANVSLILILYFKGEGLGHAWPLAAFMGKCHYFEKMRPDLELKHKSTAGGFFPGKARHCFWTATNNSMVPLHHCVNCEWLWRRVSSK